MTKSDKTKALGWALNQAVNQEDVKKVKALVFEGADANFVPDTTILMHCAATTFNLELFKAMITDIKVLETRDSRGWNAMMYALEAGNLAVVRFCVQQGIPVNNDTDYDQPLSLAIQAGRVGIVKFLLKSGAQVNAEDLLGRTPIMHALAKGNTEVAMMLVSHGSDLYHTDAQGKTVLSYALESNSLSVIKYSLELAKIQLPSNVLLLAVRAKSDLDVLKYLVSKGADILFESKEDLPGTLLREAVLSGKEEIVKYLLKQGAPMGENILEIAARKGNLDIIKLIYKYEPPMGNRKRVIDAVVQSGSVKLLISLLPEIKTMGRDDQYHLLFVAVRSGSLNMFEMLRDELDLDVDCQDSKGSSLLFEAVILEKEILPPGKTFLSNDDFSRIRRNVSDRFGRYELLKTLVEKENLEVNHTDCDGVSAIMVAARYLNFPAIRFLEKHGASLYQKDSRDVSAETILMETKISKIDQRKLEKVMAEGTCLGKRPSIRRHK
ncbi:ankyrin repeat-containing protein [Sphaerochaeta pleomorpha str. Grapes]|uniref:Ankyrin repeat-containing protein n=1 Tax=Sphaerochaeta pleomorpha (strain ATCC BAA-1885 / DSM 22778 / Grapes) TaxID=158190 RepID=G8QU13_SPHPG|nr:ankyrin repeat domain-containing protein [Sphaerochaeta pleomorpha]AEV30260.1 ankyrin repeat-containing protein [Sphaerochaeta pleomorpha str. Grapes]